MHLQLSFLKLLYPLTLLLGPRQPHLRHASPYSVSAYLTMALRDRKLAGVQALPDAPTHLSQSKDDLLHLHCKLARRLSPLTVRRLIHHIQLTVIPLRSCRGTLIPMRSPLVDIHMLHHSLFHRIHTLGRSLGTVTEPWTHRRRRDRQLRQGDTNALGVAKGLPDRPALR